MRMSEDELIDFLKRELKTRVTVDTEGTLIKVSISIYLKDEIIASSKDGDVLNLEVWNA